MKEAIQLLIEGGHLSEARSAELLGSIMEGEAEESQIGAILALLRRNGETPEEVAGMAEAMRARAVKIPWDRGRECMDLCGTGGDGRGTINISTAVSFVVASCGVVVAKHGNRAASSRSGGADVLEELGLSLEATPEKLAGALRDVGICFLFARSMHPAMKHVAGARKALGVRTIFNMLGPLTNPVKPGFQLLGVFSPDAATLMADAMSRMDIERAWLVHGAEGLDEVSPCGVTRVWAVENKSVRTFEVQPSDFGFSPVPLSAIKGGEASENALVLRSVFDGKKGPALDVVLMNAACALVVAGKAADIKGGVAMARDAIQSGRAKETLEKLIRFMKR